MERYDDYDGLCMGFSDRRRDLRAGADFDGKDEDDAGKDHGSFGMYRRVFEFPRMV